MVTQSWAGLQQARRMRERDKEARVIRDRERIQDMANMQMAVAGRKNKRANIIGKRKWANLDTTTAEGRRMDADTYRAVDRLVEDEKMSRALNSAQIAMSAASLGQGMMKGPAIGKETAKQVGGITDKVLQKAYVPETTGSSGIQDIVRNIHGDLTSQGHKIKDLGSVTAKKGPGLLGKIGKGMVRGISKLPSPKELLEFNKARRAGFLGNFDIWKSIQGATFTEMP